MGRTTTFILSAALLQAGGLSATQAAPGKECKALYKTEGAIIPGPTEAIARMNARNNWHLQVQKKYTLKFANWDNADSRKYDCGKKTTPTGINAHWCTAQAKPCAFN